MGCVLTGTLIANDSPLTNGITLSVATLASVPPGIWIFTSLVFIYPNGAVSTLDNFGVRTNMSTAINTGGGSLLQVTSEGTNYVNPVAFPKLNGTTCLTVTSTTTYYMNVTVQFSGDIRFAATGSFFKATRIG